MFNVRVYGLLIYNNQILVVREPVKNNLIVKFPGGGLEFGEGTLDGLKREFREELQVQITKMEHFYTTDFFVKSFINPNDQVISIYYLVDVNIEELNYVNEEGLTFTWVPLDELESSLFQLPIDKHVVDLINQRFKVSSPVSN